MEMVSSLTASDQLTYDKINGGKPLIYAIVAFEEERRFMILFEKREDGTYVEFFRATQGHTVTL